MTGGAKQEDAVNDTKCLHEELRRVPPHWASKTTGLWPRDNFGARCYVRHRYRAKGENDGVDADHERTPVLKKRGWEGEDVSAV